MLYLNQPHVDMYRCVCGLPIFVNYTYKEVHGTFSSVLVSCMIAFLIWSVVFHENYKYFRERIVYFYFAELNRKSLQLPAQLL